MHISLQTYNVLTSLVGSFVFREVQVVSNGNQAKQNQSCHNSVTSRHDCYAHVIVSYFRYSKYNNARARRRESEHRLQYQHASEKAVDFAIAFWRGPAALSVVQIEPTSFQATKCGNFVCSKIQIASNDNQGRQITP